MQDNVRRGMELLDTTRPGWRDKIDLTILDMNDTQCCIIGQLADDYYKSYEAILEPVLNEYRNLEEAAVAYGFQLDYFTDSPNYKELTEAWREALGT